jgi:hypothetical protein
MSFKILLLAPDADPSWPEKIRRGWHRTAAMGVFGATAAAGMLIGLTAKQMLNAFGIAYSHAAGNRQCILDAALTKRMRARNLVRELHATAGHKPTA